MNCKKSKNTINVSSFISESELIEKLKDIFIDKKIIDINFDYFDEPDETTYLHIGSFNIILEGNTIVNFDAEYYGVDIMFIINKANDLAERRNS